MWWVIVEGWLLDVHEHVDGSSMTAWVVDDFGQAHACTSPWPVALHVAGDVDHLHALEHWLSQPELVQRFSIQCTRFMQARLHLEQHDRQRVLEVMIGNHRALRSLAEHVEARGNYHRFTLHSVDAHLAQRFLTDIGCPPFTRVVWDGERLRPVASWSDDEPGFPPFHVVDLRWTYADPNGFASVSDGLVGVTLTTRRTPGFAPSAHRGSCEVQRVDHPSVSAFLDAVQAAVVQLDPDVIVTVGGDHRFFPSLMHWSELAGTTLRLGRTQQRLAQSTGERTVHSYGQTLHKHGSFFFEGRLHIDLNNSFIVREGGLAGLFELAQHSYQSAQTISRLSPGSVISAIQMRVAMDDGVLVPWKKNRSEDTKSAWELLHADRGGLYLDSQAGVHGDVTELDFASLFPSIIATRNISPETLNCSCCQPPSETSHPVFVPLHPERARREFQQRHMEERFGHGLFPLPHRKALAVPGLHMHTCARQQGFLGRVVAPLIERRRELKALRCRAGDAYDQRQNALKWLLVTCFGYTGYRNARFGRIEAHEAICAWARDILLTTIEMANDDGWEVLHAIVDCVWIQDRQRRSPAERQADALALAERVSERIGIPLEFEHHYPYIAFLPSRLHGGGSLTKYWGFTGEGYKVRGIEMRQHSTSRWVAELQQQALDVLATFPCEDGVPSYDAQHAVLRLYRSELQRLQSGDVPLEAAVIARRVTKELHQYRSRSLTWSALLRAQRTGHRVPPGGKIRFVVVDLAHPEHHERVRLKEELPLEDVTPCTVHYAVEAERAVWAVLGPFGWTESSMRTSGLQRRLSEFAASSASTGY